MRLQSPSTARNRDVILTVLRDYAPTSGFALETSAGSGEHGVHFASAFPEMQWQPTDIADESIASIAAWRTHTGLTNLLPPVILPPAIFSHGVVAILLRGNWVTRGFTRMDVSI